MSDIDVIAYLTSKGLHGRQSGNEVRYPCFFDCQEPATSRKRKLYVNVEEGYYHCFVCQASGGTFLLQKHFGDEPVRDMPGVDQAARRRALEEAAELAHQMLLNNDDVLLWLLNERGLSEQSILDRRLGWVGNNWGLAGSLEHPLAVKKSAGLVWDDGREIFTNHLTMPYQQRGTVVWLRGRNMGSGGAKYIHGPDQAVRLFNIDSLVDAEEAILVEGELDAMRLAEVMARAPEDRARRMAVVGVPGANALPESLEGQLTDCKRVFIGFDPDDAGARGAVAVKERLGTKARILELPTHAPKCDWTEYLAADGPHAGHGWRDVLDLCGNAVGKRLFSVREAGYRFRTARAATGGLKLGYTAIDATIEPGLLPGQVMVILAKTGTGKTLMLCNIAANLHTTPTLFITLEMTQEEVYERLSRIWRFWHPRASDREVEEAFSRLLICDENRLGDGDVARLVDEFEVETGVQPDLVLLDYLGYYAQGARGNSRYEKVSNAIMDLKAQAKAKRIRLVTPHQVSRQGQSGKPLDMDDARDSGVVEETADFMAAVYRPDDALRDENAQPSGKVKFEWLKSRHGGKGRVFTLQMDLLTLAIVEAATPAAKKAEQHNWRHFRGGTYEELRRDETQPIQQALVVS